MQAEVFVLVIGGGELGVEARRGDDRVGDRSGDRIGVNSGAGAGEDVRELRVLAFVFVVVIEGGGGSGGSGGSGGGGGADGGADCLGIDVVVDQDRRATGGARGMGRVGDERLDGGDDEFARGGAIGGGGCGRGVTEGPSGFRRCA